MRVTEEIEQEIENILKKSINNGGIVYFSSTVFAEVEYNRVYLADINSELLRFGRLYELNEYNGTWDKFELSRAGRLFIENGGFEGERKDKLQNISDLELDRNSKRATIHGAETAFHTLNVSVIAGLIALIALIMPVMYTGLSCTVQEYVAVLLIVLFLVAAFLLFREALAARKGLIKDNQDRNIP